MVPPSPRAGTPGSRVRYARAGSRPALPTRCVGRARRDGRGRGPIWMEDGTNRLISVVAGRRPRRDDHRWVRRSVVRLRGLPRPHAARPGREPYGDHGRPDPLPAGRRRGRGPGRALAGPARRPGSDGGVLARRHRPGAGLVAGGQRRAVVRGVGRARPGDGGRVVRGGLRGGGHVVPGPSAGYGDARHHHRRRVRLDHLHPAVRPAGRVVRLAAGAGRTRAGVRRAHGAAARRRTFAACPPPVGGAHTGADADGADTGAGATPPRRCHPDGAARPGLLADQYGVRHPGRGRLRGRRPPRGVPARTRQPADGGGRHRRAARRPVRRGPGGDHGGAAEVPGRCRGRADLRGAGRRAGPAAVGRPRRRRRGGLRARGGDRLRGEHDRPAGDGGRALRRRRLRHHGRADGRDPHGHQGTRPAGRGLATHRFRKLHAGHGRLFPHQPGRRARPRRGRPPAGSESGWTRRRPGSRAGRRR